MKKLLLSLSLTLLAVGCGPIPHTGFEIRVRPPDTTKLKPGIDYNSLYVDVNSDGVEKSIKVPIGENTKKVNGNYVMVVTMDGEKHTKATITVTLFADEVNRASHIEPDVPVKQGELSVFNVDLTNAN